MTKKIYLIVQQSRVNTPQDEWNDSGILYTVKSLKQALKDKKMHNDKRKKLSSTKNYLNFRYRIEIVELYD